MKTPNALPLTTTAMLTLAEIKAATEAFDRGDANVFDALDAVVVAIEAYRAKAYQDAKRGRRRWDAA